MFTEESLIKLHLFRMHHNAAENCLRKITEQLPLRSPGWDPNSSSNGLQTALIVPMTVKNSFMTMLSLVALCKLKALRPKSSIKQNRFSLSEFHLVSFVDILWAFQGERISLKFSANETAFCSARHSKSTTAVNRSVQIEKKTIGAFQSANQLVINTLQLKWIFFCEKDPIASRR